LKKLFLLIFILIALISCKSVPKSDSTVKFKMIIEAEDFALKDCLIVENPRASGGRAVRLDKITSEGSKEIILKAGEYVLQAVVFSPNSNQDELLLRIGPHEVNARAKNYNEFNYCRVFLDFPIKDKAGKPIKISFAALKTGFLVDKIEIVKKADWINPFK
jgi:hypothetical protein